MLDQEPDDLCQELIVGHPRDCAVLKVQSIRQMLPDLVVAMSRPELKVSSPQRENDGQRVLLRDCEARNDVGRYERYSWPRELVGKFC